MSASTSCRDLAERLLAGPLRGEAPDLDLARQLVREQCSELLFRVVVEAMADRFDPALCDASASIFLAVLEEVDPRYGALPLRERYERVRRPRVCRKEPERVYVLSRVTLGADIAVTSVLLSAAKQRFPKARILFAGSARNAELWAADPRVEQVDAPYPRTGSLSDRVDASRRLEQLLADDSSIVLDPDSRLTQLGLIPVCPEDRYFFFESRAFGGVTLDALPALTAKWCAETLGVAGKPYLSLVDDNTRKSVRMAISFGVGENPAKRVGDRFEAELLRIADKPAIVDCGAGGEEAARVESAITRAGAAVERWRGSFAGFAGRIQQSAVYCGYDSAGQHAAAALGVPCVTVFRGYVSRRMFARWRPTGPGWIEIVDAEGLTEEEILERTASAISRARVSG